MQDEDTPGQFCSPENPIADCNARTLPTILYPFIEGSNPRKDRSFGQLALGDVESCLAKASLGAASSPPTGASDDSVSDTESSSGSVPSDCAATAPGSGASTDPSAVGDAPASLAEKVLVREWDRREELGLFRYNVRECSTKARARQGALLPGRLLRCWRDALRLNRRVASTHGAAAPYR